MARSLRDQLTWGPRIEDVFPIEHGDFPLLCDRLPEGIFQWLIYMGGDPNHGN